jgi:large subunit ribosomal protein L18
MAKTSKKYTARLRRHRRVRAHVSGTTTRPRLNVYRSNENIYVQLIDDESGHTLVSASTVDGELRKQTAELSKIDSARLVGKTIAERAKAAGITSVVFDRGGWRYQGRVKALAEGAREGGLEF